MKISKELKELIEDKNTIPAPELVFRAFSYFKPKDTKVIIIGQDPYPDKLNASGLAFSVEHNKIPASLRNIFKELRNDLGYKIPETGNLEPWAKQGVLLLNTILTVKKGKSGSHSGKGWEKFTIDKIQNVLDLKTPVVIIAWGNFAHEVVSNLLTHDQVLILQGAHPSPLNRSSGFFGGKFFSRANEFLTIRGISPIDWKL